MQLIEASAGTGKTWTLAALYVRLVLGHAPGADAAPLGSGLFPPQILVMTFTEAATAELRERIRERLALSARYFHTGAPELADDFLRTLRDQIAPDQWPDCAWRLDMAAQWMDDAAIFTIHGWSSRMLKTHAFDSASLFTQSRVEDSDRLKLIAAQDYWRHWFYALDVQALPALKAIGDTPLALLDKLQALWRSAERAPRADAPDPEAPDSLLARWSQWHQRREELEAAARPGWTAQVVQSIQDAAAAKLLSNYRSNWLPGWLAQMADWVQGEDIAPDTLVRFTLSTLQDKGWAAASNWPVFAQLEALHQHLQTEPDVVTDLLAHAAVAVLRAYQAAKAQAAQFDFADLLQNLYRALQAPDGRLASAIRAQYPVALVDEFQDTDPWQFGSLIKIYSCLRIINKGYSPISCTSDADQPSATAHPEPVEAPDSFDLSAGIEANQTSSQPLALIMIGDPKQAIYSFRGADLATYLTARDQAQGIYTLPGNYRSTPGVVAAVNQVFGKAHAPFGSVPFVPVQACNAKVVPLQVGGQPQTAMTVWHLPYAKPPAKDVFLSDMAAVFATRMVALLQSGAAQPGDMALLVRDWREAQAIRDALAQRGVRSVYLSERNSVYASGEASDLWRMLRAVVNPGHNRLVRAALATRTWGLSPQALDTLFANESAWDGVVEQFMQWQRVWRVQGFLPMLYRLLHDQGLAARLLQNATQGERSLTNLLHLGELLQAASLELQGEGALIRYLEDQLRRPQTSGEAGQLRLESDAHLVQVVTLHKSKGLEYPLVFLPFVSNYRAESKDSDRKDDERLSEDIRLLYVALTRAKQALWLGVAQLKGDVEGKTPSVKSALSALLGRSTPGDLWERLQSWACEHIAVLPAPEPDEARYQPPTEAHIPQPAKLPRRVLQRGWWSASFSALTRDLAHGSARETMSGGAPSAPLPSERDERMMDAQVDGTPVEAAPLPFEAALQPPGSGLTARGNSKSAALPLEPDLLSTEPPLNDFPAGSRYGTLLHDLLEWQAQHGWPGAAAIQGDVDSFPLPQGEGQGEGEFLAVRVVDASGKGRPHPSPLPEEEGVKPKTRQFESHPPAPADEALIAPTSEWQTLLARQAERLSLLPEHSAMLDGWISTVIKQKLPLAKVKQAQSAITLGAIEACDMWPEMGFSLPVQALGSQQLDLLITQHIWPHQPRAALQPRQLEGMLTGFMDLVLLHEGRYYVLDYKSNRLPDYTAPSLQQAMLAHRYDVQASLYLLALHRLLKSRLPGYSYEQHIGGALYLFLRGIDQPGCGMLHLSPPGALVEVLDEAFSGEMMG
jgi:exodeoxyribonuclease V beta subunit